MVGATAGLVILGLITCWPLVWRHKGLQTGNDAGHNAVADFCLRATGGSNTKESWVGGENLNIEVVDSKGGDSDDTV